MPIAVYKPGAKPPIKQELPKTSAKTYKTNVVDERYTPTSSLSPYIGGYPETVREYFGQVLGEHDEPREIDVGSSAPHQEYYTILNMDMRVQTPLDPSYDPNEALTQVTGVAILYPAVVPNTYDHFVMESTRGRPALFMITDTNRETMNRDSPFRIDYSMVGYLDTPEIASMYESLKKKTTSKYFFHAERLAKGLTPILKEEDSHNSTQLAHAALDITSYLIKDFLNPKYRTLLVPGQNNATFDLFVVNHLLRMTSMSDIPEVRGVMRYGTDNDRFMKQPQFWSVLQSRSASALRQANPFMGVVSRSSFSQDNWIVGAGYSMLGYYVYPSMVDESVRSSGDGVAKTVVGVLEDPYTAPMGSSPGCGGPLDDVYKDALTETVYYKRVLCDHYYVLSMEFYKREPGQSVLELLVWDYLEHRAIDLSRLVELVNRFFQLPRLEQFYYGPILVTLIHASHKALYT